MQIRCTVSIRINRYIILFLNGDEKDGISHDKIRLVVNQKHIFLCTASKNPQRQARSKLKVQSIFSETKYYELFYLEHVKEQDDYTLLTPELLIFFEGGKKIQRQTRIVRRRDTSFFFNIILDIIFS
jgi:hypothetical protein